MRHRHPRTIPVPPDLVADIERSLAELDRARADLEGALRACASLRERRAVRAAVSAAFADADRLLRRATAIARPGPYSEWRVWRHRLSQLDLAKQRHLFGESDDVACLDMGSVRVVDTGMEKPNIGELVYGHSRPPGAPAHYGLDMAAVLSTSQPQQPIDAAQKAATAPAGQAGGEQAAAAAAARDQTWPSAA